MGVARWQCTLGNSTCKREFPFARVLLCGWVSVVRDAALHPSIHSQLACRGHSTIVVAAVVPCACRYTVVVVGTGYSASLTPAFGSDIQGLVEFGGLAHLVSSTGDALLVLGGSVVARTVGSAPLLAAQPCLFGCPGTSIASSVAGEYITVVYVGTTWYVTSGFGDWA